MLLGAGEIIKNSWQIFAENFRKLITYMILLFIPNVILGFAGIMSIYLDKFATTDTFIVINNVIVIAIIVASIVFTVWVAMALTKSLGAIIAKKASVPAKEGLSSTSHLIWPVIYTSLLVMLIVLGGTVMLIVPGIIFSIWYAFAYYAIIFEEKKGMEALKASKRLVAGRWWRIFWLLLGPSFFYALILMVVSYAITYGLTFVLTDLAFIVTNGLISGAISAVLAPLTALVTIILYFNAKENPVPATPSAEVK